MVTRNKKFDQDEFVFELTQRLKENLQRGPNIKKYVPHAKQELFHRSTLKKKLYIGGNRSGKTTGGVTEAIWRATSRHPYRPELNTLGPTRGRVIAVDFINGVEKIIFPQYKQWLYPSALRGGSWETAYSKLERVLTFSNGSTIEFMSYDQDLDKFAGTSRHWVHFDEEPPQSIYIENKARLIDTDGEFWITMTPVEGMTWVHDDLYEGNVNNPDASVFIVEINTLENPYLNQQAIESFLEDIDEDETTARIAGQFVQVGGRIYKNFDPTPGAIQVLKEPIESPKQRFKDWLWIMCLDHGLNNPTAVLWIAVDKEGFAVVFDEHYVKEWTIDKHAEAIKNKIKEHGRMPDLLVADPSIKNRNAVSGTSIQEEYQKYGLSWTLGNNDVKAGIIRVKRYLNRAKYVGRRTNPLFDKALASGANLDEFPRLRISPVCQNLIWEMKRYRWKTYSNKKLTYDNNAFEEPHKKDDHACDALRYGIMTQPDLSAENSNLSDRVSAAMEDMQFEFAQAGGGIQVADPHDLLNDPNWEMGNSIPQSNGWEVDEHLGGVW